MMPPDKMWAYYGTLGQIHNYIEKIANSNYEIFFSLSEHRLPFRFQVGTKTIFYTVNGGKNESRQNNFSLALTYCDIKSHGATYEHTFSYVS